MLRYLRTLTKLHNSPPADDRTRLSFLPIGVWDEDTELRFFAPVNPAETSHSVFDLQGTGNYFLAECRKLSSIMHELGHDHIDLLKLDIEGAWRNVIKKHRGRTHQYLNTVRGTRFAQYYSSGTMGDQSDGKYRFGARTL